MNGEYSPKLRVIVAVMRFLSLGIGLLLCATGMASPLAIKGYDPVAYFTLQRATPGDARLTWEWDEHVWQFSTAGHRDLFKADPVKYAPQFSNFCAVALARGEVKEANPEYWLISDGRLYLFGKPFGPDLFRQQLGENIERANRNRALLPKAQPRE
jgi:hypothetical protein